MSLQDTNDQQEDLNKQIDSAQDLTELSQVNILDNEYVGGYQLVRVIMGQDPRPSNQFRDNLEELKKIKDREEQIAFIEEHIMPYQMKQCKVHIPHIVKEIDGESIEDESFIFQVTKQIYKLLVPARYGQIDYENWSLKGMRNFKFRKALPEGLRSGTAGMVFYCQDAMAMYDLADNMAEVVSEMQRKGIAVPSVNEKDVTAWPRYSYPVYCPTGNTQPPIFYTYGDGDFKDILKEMDLLNEFFDETTNYAIPIRRK